MEQFNISLQYGIHRTPSLGNDGELSECVNLIPQDGELVNLQEPVATGVTLNNGETLLYMHDNAGFVHYILQSENGVYWFESINDVRDNAHKICDLLDVKQVKSVGSTLVLFQEEGMSYVIWKNNAYVFLGSELPDVSLSFSLDGVYEQTYEQNLVSLVKGSSSDAGQTYDEQIATLVCDRSDQSHWEYHGTAPAVTIYANFYLNMSSLPIQNNTWYKVVADKKFKTSLSVYAVNSQGVETPLLDSSYQHSQFEFYVEDASAFARLKFRLLISSRGNGYSQEAITLNLLQGVNQESGLIVENTEANFTALCGMANQFISKKKAKGQFIYPFFVRYALRMSDGTHMKPSAPCLMLPNTGSVPYLFTDLTSAGRASVYCGANVSKLTYSVTYKDNDQLRNWSDLITGVDIAISQPIYSYNQGANYDGETNPFSVIVNEADWDTGESMFGRIRINSTNYYGEVTLGFAARERNSGITGPMTRIKLPEFESGLYEKMFTSEGNFYIVDDIPLESLVNMQPLLSAEVNVEDEELNGLMAKETIVDNYSSLFQLRPKSGAEYNNRMFIYDIGKRVFNGFHPELMMCNSNYAKNGQPIKSDYVYWYVLKGAENGFPYEVVCPIPPIIDEGEPYEVIPSNSTPLRWFYYPSATAKSVVLYRFELTYHTYEKCEIELKKHDYLYGAYAFASNDEVFVWEDLGIRTSETTPSISDIYNIVANTVVLPAPNSLRYTQEANPFNFPSGLSLTVGSGKIMTLCPITKALSQGQFGQFPLRAFCSDGIWALPISDEGKVLKAKPASRDVMVEGSEICQLDDAVVFVTNQGLKMITGSDVILLSAPVEGYNLNEAFIQSAVEVFAAKVHATCPFVSDTSQFVEQVKTVKMAYDYAHNLLHVFFQQEPAAVLDASTSVYKHYVYSFDTREWATQVLNEQLVAVVPGYPLSTLQFGTTLKQYEKTVGAEPHISYALTRPLALGDPFARKALYDLRVVGQQTMANTVRRVAVYVSNDNVNWHRLPSLKALSAKYYRFLIMSFMADTDTISGLTLQHDVRYSHKLRGH